jgi:hypothetical protein
MEKDGAKGRESMMTPEQYMMDRVDDQLRYYERRSDNNQKWFRRLRIIEIVAAALIPFLTGYAGQSITIQIIIGILGVAIAVSAGVMALYGFQENWTSFRATCAALRYRKILFNTQSAPYDTADPFPLFLEDIESILANEQQQWVGRQRISRQPQQGNQQPAAQAPTSTAASTSTSAAR